jgi:hypothetical protein
MRPPTVLLTAALAAVLALGVTACTSESDGGSPSAAGCVTGEPRAAAKTLVEHRDRAVQAGDSEAFLETVGGDRTVRDEQRAWFERVEALPDADVTLEIGVDRAAAADSLTAYVNVGVRLAGIDAEPVGVEHLTTFARDEGCWRITEEHVDASQVVAAPWDVAGTVVLERGHVVLVTDFDDEDDRRQLLGAAVDAWRTERTDLAPITRRASDRGVLLIAFDEPDALEAAGIYHGDLDLTAAVTLASGPGADPADNRVMLAPWMERVDGDELARILRHEFVHVLLARWSRTPQWATEGAAEYFATGLASDPTARVTSLLSGADLAASGLAASDFYDHDGRLRVGNYVLGWAAMRWLAQEQGDLEPARLLQALDRAHAYDGRSVDRVLESRYGLDGDGLLARARDLASSLQSG